MGDVSAEPSMEDILSSIKRIIAEDVEAGGVTAKRRRVAPAPVVEDVDEDVLELNEPAPDPAPMPMSDPVAAAEPVAAASEPKPEPVAVVRTAAAPEKIVSDETAEASRAPLANLSKLVVKPETSGADTLEGLVREMLKPMLREWLDANLPGMVEGMVAKEIARITGAR